MADSSEMVEDEARGYQGDKIQQFGDKDHDNNGEITKVAMARPSSRILTPDERRAKKFEQNFNGQDARVGLISSTTSGQIVTKLSRGPGHNETERLSGNDEYGEDLTDTHAGPHPSDRTSTRGERDPRKLGQSEVNMGQKSSLKQVHSSENSAIAGNVESTNHGHLTEIAGDGQHRVTSDGEQIHPSESTESTSCQEFTAEFGISENNIQYQSNTEDQMAPAQNENATVPDAPGAYRITGPGLTEGESRMQNVIDSYSPYDEIFVSARRASVSANITTGEFRDDIDELKGDERGDKVMVTATAERFSLLVGFVQDHCFLVVVLILVFVGGIAGLSAYLVNRNYSKSSMIATKVPLQDSLTPHPSKSLRPSNSLFPSSSPSLSPSNTPTEPCNMPLDEWIFDVTKMMEGLVKDRAAPRAKDFPLEHAIHWITTEDGIFPRLCPNKDSHRLMQRFGLALMHFSMDGNNWKYSASEGNAKFLDRTSECDWSGVECNSDTYRVTEIKLSSRNLKGSIPAEIFSIFKDLRVLNLANNRIEGPIPDEIGYVSNLEFFYLSNNHLAAPLPASLGNLAKMEVLDLSNNFIRGELPSSFSGLGRLTHLNMARNEISGGIPSDIGLLKNLKVFEMSHNSLTGGIPVEIGYLSNLTSLLLHENNLGGTFPSGLATLAGLEVLNLRNNGLSGEIPNTMKDMSRLEHLSLSHNKFSGPLPEALGGLKSLKVARLENNLRLRGSVPVTFTEHSNLEALLIQHTGITSVNNCICKMRSDNGGNLKRLGASCDPSRKCIQSLPLCIICLPPEVDPGCVERPIFDDIDETCPVKCDEMIFFCLDDKRCGTDCPCCDCVHDCDAPGSNILPPKCPYKLLQNQTREERILSFLGNISDGSLLLQPTSPQGKAASWIINTDEFSFGSIDAELLKERYFLALLYFSTNGDKWLSCSAQETSLCGTGEYVGKERFLSNTSVCDWAGVVCNMEGRVTQLILGGNGLEGTVPFRAFSGNCGLLHLNHFDVSGNALGGTLGANIFKIGRITTLLLDDNQFNGTMPSQWRSGIEKLRLHYNSLSGSIPQGMGDFARSLKELRLDNNMLTGTLPDSIGDLENLEILTIHDNNLNGSVPGVICDLAFKRGGMLEEIWADCEGAVEAQIHCDCCTQCFSKGR